MRAEPITFTYIVRDPLAEEAQPLAIGDTAPQANHQDKPVLHYNLEDTWPSAGDAIGGQQDALKADVDGDSSRQAPQGVLALMADGHTR